MAEMEEFLRTKVAESRHEHYIISRGSTYQTITDKDGIYDLMMRLYQKWEDQKVEELEDMGGGLQWLE